MRKLIIPTMFVAVIGIIWVWLFEGMNPPVSMPVANEQPHTYAAHENIRATTFWVGEDADQSNNFIDNHASAWTLDWVGAYGGIDSPSPRCGHYACGFTPKQNPFYFALPYNDLDDFCKTKESQKRVLWYSGQTPPGQSIIKNRWIEVRFKDKTAYAQWEDAGPSGEDDAGYVFGAERPAVTFGLDLSPATSTYLGTDGDDVVSWRFVAEDAVPAGPWKNIVTTSAPDCAL
jgi:hypothetical protein